MMRVLASLLLLLFVASAGCGKYGAPERTRPSEGPSANEAMQDFEREMADQPEEDANR